MDATRQKQLCRRANRCGAGALAYLACLAGLRGLFSLLLGLGVRGASLHNPAGLSAGQAQAVLALAQLLSLLLPGLAFCRWCGLRPLTPLAQRPPAGWAWPVYPLFLCGAMGAGVLGGWFRARLGAGPPSPALPEGGPALAAAFLGSCLLPALGEEWLFRGLFQGFLRPWGSGPAILTSALLFGLLHGEAGQCLAAFLCGLLLGLLAEGTGSLWPAVALHFGNNLLIFAGEWAARYADEGAALSLRLMILTGLPALALTALLRGVTGPRKPLLPCRLRPGAPWGLLARCPVLWGAVALLALRLMAPVWGAG